jgi:hypothetical protein
MLNAFIKVIEMLLVSAVWVFSYAEEAAYRIKRHNRLTPTLGTVLVTWLGLVAVVLYIGEQIGVVS